LPLQSLKRCRQQSSREPPEQDDSVYRVEKIVSGEKRGRIRYFLIKWEGYPEEENTWEPERNLLGASVKRMVAAYKKANRMK